MMKIILLLLLKLSLLASIGNIMAIKGSADIKHSSTTEKAKNGMAIEEGDSIVTSKKSRVQVMLSDDTVVTIGSSSVFKFEEYLYDASKKSKLTMRANRGFFRSVTGKIGKLAPERFKVKTASATIGIRGTDFSGEILGDREVFKCYSGGITIEFDGGSQDVDAGMMAEVIKDSFRTDTSKSEKSESKSESSDGKSEKSESKSEGSDSKSEKSSTKPKSIVVKSISSADVSSEESGETTTSSSGGDGKSSGGDTSSSASPSGGSDAAGGGSEVSSSGSGVTTEMAFDDVSDISSSGPDIPTETIADVTQIIEDDLNVPIEDGTAEPVKPGDDRPVYIPTGAVSQ